MSHRGARHDTPSDKDWIYRQARDEIAHRQYPAPVFDQGQHQACVWNALAGMCVALVPEWQPSRLWGWRASRIKENRLYLDAPIMVRTAIDVLRKNGFVPEKYWPYEDGLEFRKPKPLEAWMWQRRQMTASKLDLTKSDGQCCLDRGWPFMGLIRITPSIEAQLNAPRTEPLVKPDPSEETLGYHCVWWRKREDAGLTRLVNSYGVGVGDKGEFLMADDHLMDPNEVGSAWTIRI